MRAHIDGHDNRARARFSGLGVLKRYVDANGRVSYVSEWIPPRVPRPKPRRLNFIDRILYKLADLAIYHAWSRVQ